jgi:hypothetical protein
MKPITAMFHRDGFQYMITARRGKTPKEELIRIIEHMEPIGPHTLRKS